MNTETLLKSTYEIHRDEILSTYAKTKTGDYINYRNFVPGTYVEGSEYLFIAEAPGKMENDLMMPLVGPAGVFLRKRLQRIGIKPDMCSYTNVWKWRPPDNRTPTGKERSMGRKILPEEIIYMKPRIVVLLGQVANKAMFHPSTIARGVVVHDKAISWIATYHPSYVMSYRMDLEDEFERHLTLARG